MAGLKTDSLRFKWAKFKFNSALGRGSRIRVYRQIKAMIRNNIPIKDALEAVLDRASDSGKKPMNPEALMARLWIQRIDDGKSLSDAMADCVPVGEQMMIEAGELGGSFEKTIGNVVKLLQMMSKIRGALFKAISYPAALVALLYAALVLFGIYVIPPFATALPIDKWTGVAGQMATLSQIVRWAAIPGALLLVGATTLFVYSLPRWSNKLRTKFDRMPPWSLYRMFVGTSFMLSLGALVGAEVPVQYALPKLRDRGTPYLKVRIGAALRKVTDGILIGDALYQTGYEFPDKQIVADLRIYAKMPSFSEMLDTISEEWVDQTVERIGAQAAILRNIMLVLVTMVIMYLSYGMYDITMQVSQAAQYGV